MVCRITIERIEGGRVAGGHATSVRIFGTATDCAAVQGFVGNGVSPPFYGRTEAAAFDGVNYEIVARPNVAIGGSLQCGSTLGVLVQCEGTSPPCQEFVSLMLVCPAAADCPVIESLMATPGMCLTDGRREVVLSAEVTTPASSPANVKWDFGDGTVEIDGTFILPGVTETVTSEPHPYPTGTGFSAFLLVEFPPGCMADLPTTVAVGPLEPCPDTSTMCPRLSIAPVMVPVGGCAGGGSTISLTFTAVLDPAIADARYGWSISRGGTVVFSLAPDAPESGPAIPFRFEEPGEYSVAVTAIWAGQAVRCMVPVSVPFEVPSCCGNLLDPALFPPSLRLDCTAGTSAATVTLTVHTEPPNAPGTYIWHFGDEAPAETTTSNTSPPHTYSSPGRRVIGVTRISDRRDCEGQKFGFEIDVPACGGTPPPTTSNFACGLPIWLIAAAAGLFLSTAVLALTPLGCFPTCPPSPALADFYIALGIGAGVALVVGAVLVGLAALLCELDVCPCLSECDWLRITWIGLLIAALVAGYLAGCCTPLWTIGVVAVAAAGAGVAFVAWYLRCDPSFCRVIADIAWATGSAVGTIFIYLPLLLAAYPCPEAATCGAAIVAVVTGAVSLVTGTIALTSCID